MLASVKISNLRSCRALLFNCNGLIQISFRVSRYFTGTDGYKTHMYNYWHGVLAGYFENVDDMDRKAEVSKK